MPDTETLRAAASLPRFWSKVQKQEGGDGCWLWTASRDRYGYGQFNTRGVVRRAHTLAYEEAYGPVPVGLVLDHLCRTRRCVRPAHLEAVTIAENVRRGFANITACPEGHEYAGDNLLVSGGRRRCRACHNANAHVARDKRTAANGY